MAYRKIDSYDEATTAQLAEHCRAILELLGEDPEREGLLKTPERVAKAMQFLTNGYLQDGKEILMGALFEEKYSQMVLVKDISKIARVVECYARRLQVQERLTTQILECIDSTLKPLGTAVVIEAAHTCMRLRGVQKEHSLTTTSAFSGAFLKDPRTRDEFLHLIGQKMY